MTRRHRVGVFGGTFDPVHFGHLRPALEIGEALALDELRLIPCHQPPHRGTPGASSADRLAMLYLAVADQPQFVVDSRELGRDGPSYSVDTLKSLRDEQPEAMIVLCLGMDAFAGFTRWHRWQEILELAHLLVTPRPDAELPSEPAQLLADRRVESVSALDACFAGKIFLQPVTQLAISATAVRELVAAGRDPNFLLPLAVRAYLREHGLYQPPPSQR
jgi:nicotinate-nucleotide adenylyltransferase